jgi:hypothetical protein
MRNWIICLAAVTAMSPLAGAHEGHDHAAKSGKLTGEVVDITCFMDHDSKGEKHAACASRCIEKGLPVGLLVGDKLYAIILGSHDSPNEKLAPYAGKLVTMTGSISEKSGMRVIDMDTVEPATTPAK